MGAYGHMGETRCIEVSECTGQSQAMTGFYFTEQKRLVPQSSGASLPKRPHLESGTETHPGDKKAAGCSVSTTSADARKKGGH